MQAFVDRALANGAAPYTPQDRDDDEDDDSRKPAFNMTPYERPSAPPVNMGIMSGLAPGVAAPAANQPAGPTPLGPALTNPTPVLTGPSGQGNQLLNNRGVAQVWGKKAPEPPPQPAPATPEPPKSAAPSSSSPPQPAVQPQPQPQVQSPQPPVNAGPRQLTEKEKMANALFGGVAAPAAIRPGQAARQRRASAAGSEQPIANLSPAPVAAAVVAPAPSTVSNMNLDLLDFASEPAPPLPVAPAPRPPTAAVDLFDLSAPPPVPAMPIAPAPVAPAVTSNLLDAFDSLSVATGTGASPLRITTAEFGQRWGQSSADVKQTVTTSARSLEQLRAAMPAAYGHIESIPQSLEAIFAAMTSIGSIVLIHTKLNPARMACDVTVKSTSHDICSKELSAIATGLTGFLG